MSFLEDLATQLNTAGVGVYPGTSSTRTICIGEMPDSPDACICLYPRPGRSREPYSGGELARPELHVEIRAATYLAAVAKRDAVMTALHALTNTTINGNLYVVVRAQGEMTSLGRDGRNRSIVSQNFLIKAAI